MTLQKQYLTVPFQTEISKMKLLAILFIAGCVAASQAKVVPNTASTEAERFNFPDDLVQTVQSILANLPQIPQTAAINATELVENVNNLVRDIQKVENVSDLRQIDWATTLYPLFNILFNYLIGPFLTQVISLIPVAALPTLFGGATTVEASVGYIIYSLYNPFIYVLNTYLFG